MFLKLSDATGWLFVNINRVAEIHPTRAGGSQLFNDVGVPMQNPTEVNESPEQIIELINREAFVQ